MRTTTRNDDGARVDLQLKESVVLLYMAEHCRGMAAARVSMNDV